MVVCFLSYFWEGSVLIGYEKKFVEYFVNFICEILMLMVMLFNDLKLVILIDKLI